MARLIQEHNLSEAYVTLSENRAVLRECFREPLVEIASEVQFVDVLDQLEGEMSGGRDLSFDAPDPPAGVVLVLATRPNDTLQLLQLLKPRDTYILPDMTRGDFDRLLARRGARIQPAVVPITACTSIKKVRFVSPAAK
jgi:hypothetical protein